jgi:imidazolonepropionase
VESQKSNESPSRGKNSFLKRTSSWAPIFHYNKPMLLILNASQLLTLAGGPQRGASLGTLGIIPDGAVLIEHETIAAVGTSTDLLEKYPNTSRLDACGKVVMPGFVEQHTHMVWAGDRAA